MDCNITEVFLREWKRMCNKKTCTTCRLSIHKNLSKNTLICNDYVKHYPKDAIKIVQKWSDNNPPKPKKTRQSEFLKHYPNARVNDGVLDICPLYIDGDFQFGGCNAFECADCERMYWLAEVE